MVDPKYTVSSEIAHREIEGQLLLLLPDDSYLYTLNNSGQMLWKGLLAGRGRSELAKELCDHFGLDERQALKDVGAFLTQLKRKGILVSSSA